MPKGIVLLYCGNLCHIPAGGILGVDAGVGQCLDKVGDERLLILDGVGVTGGREQGGVQRHAGALDQVGAADSGQAIVAVCLCQIGAGRGENELLPQLGGSGVAGAG